MFVKDLEKMPTNPGCRRLGVSGAKNWCQAAFQVFRSRVTCKLPKPVTPLLGVYTENAIEKNMINRYFTEENFDRLQNNFQFLVKIVQSFKGELDFAIRDNYFNLYFRGNNAAKVAFRPKGKYRIEIHENFFPSSLQTDKRYSYSSSRKYCIIETTAELLHPLLQKSRLDEIYAKIKNENYSEELTFEQMLITDNLAREVLILIDRQVTDTTLNRRRMDLLALKQTEGNQYQFLVLEVKMGKNLELKNKVAHQVNTYVNHIAENFTAYKSCYEKHYSQKRKMGIITKPNWDEIEITEGVRGKIIVGGYSVIAMEQIELLKASYPNLEVQPFAYKIV